jgi:plasmid maintenance system antidote protein VapI
MALRLSGAFWIEPRMGFDWQQQYDLWHESQRKRPKVEEFSWAA